MDVGNLLGWITAIILVGAAWGDIKRTVQKNRELGVAERKADRSISDERHEQNTEKLDIVIDDLKVVVADVKRINGTVARHAALIEVLRGRRGGDHLT